MLDAGHVFEKFGNLAGLPSELGVVSEVLILATSALTEKRAAGFGTLGRWFEDFEEVVADPSAENTPLPVSGPVAVVLLGLLLLVGLVAQLGRPRKATAL